MLQHVYSSYRGGCMMLFCREGAEVAFVGTAFLIHSSGYLLTAAHILYCHENLMVVPWEAAEDFTPMGIETVAPLPATVVQVDQDHDLALLKLSHELKITMPDHVIGTPSEVPVGSSVACLGYPLGFYHIYTQIIQQAVVSAKILSRNETRLFLFDEMIHEGTRGAPLVSLYDSRVIGVVSGRFDPQESAPTTVREGSSFNTNISYAVSIEYALPLMEKEDLEII